MTDVARAIEAIEKAAEKVGLPELSRRANVPYTTVAEWRAKGYRPKIIETFEKLTSAADAVIGEGEAA